MTKDRSLQAKNQKRSRDGQFADENKTRIPTAPKESDPDEEWVGKNKTMLDRASTLMNGLADDGRSPEGSTWFYLDYGREGAVTGVTRRGNTISSVTVYDHDMPQYLAVQGHGGQYKPMRDKTCAFEFPTSMGDREDIYDYTTLSDSAPIDVDIKNQSKATQDILDRYQKQGRDDTLVYVATDEQARLHVYGMDEVDQGMSLKTRPHAIVDGVTYRNALDTMEGKGGEYGSMTFGVCEGTDRYTLHVSASSGDDTMRMRSIIYPPDGEAPEPIVPCDKQGNRLAPTYRSAKRNHEGLQVRMGDDNAESTFTNRHGQWVNDTDGTRWSSLSDTGYDQSTTKIIKEGQK